MNIPVFHDDQHGTAIISAAAMLNGLELVGKSIGNVKVAVSGAGAAAIARLDGDGRPGCAGEHLCTPTWRRVRRSGLGFDASKARYAQATDARTLADVVVGADVFLGCSAAGVLTADMGETMGPSRSSSHWPILSLRFAQNWPKPCGWTGIVATGRSDYPNQVNNVLCFSRTSSAVHWIAVRPRSPRP